MPLPCPNAKIVYNDKTYDPEEFRAHLKTLPVEDMAKYIPGMKSIPSAPFEKTWHEMALRRIIKQAVDKGYDGVSWTPGADQNARYSLTTVADKLKYDEAKQKLVVYKDGDPIGSYSAKPEDLPGIVGKEVAQRLMDQPAAPTHHEVDPKHLFVEGDFDGNHYVTNRMTGKMLGKLKNLDEANEAARSGKVPNEDAGTRQLEGNDLEVGGNGMRGFYDKIVPDYLNKFGKKFGAKVQDTTIPTAKKLVDIRYMGPDLDGDQARTAVRSAMTNEGYNTRDTEYYVGHIGKLMDQGKNFSEAFNETFKDMGSADALPQIIAEHAGGKWGPLHEDTRIKVQHIPITPEMRKSVTEEGVPLFNRERRVDAAGRKRVEDMSPEEMKKALLTSDVTGIPNRRAFDDAEHASPSPAVAMSDADGLKALNDKFGYAAGNELLKAKADALKAAGLDAYHEKGDEFLFRGASPEELKEKLDRARQILRDRVIEATLKDGTKLQFKGADFSYGTGKDLDESETGLKQHKQEREDAGERARGELRGITQVGPKEGEDDKGSSDNWIKQGAQDFAKEHGRDINLPRYISADFRAKEIADAYETMKHNPADPKVKATYEALKKDIRQQWDYATQKMGVKFEPWKGEPGTQPYENSKEMTEDVKKNHHLWFFQGGDMAADHPLAAVDDTGFSANDQLRAVHDLFGHAMESFQFGPRGEENAWNAHSQMFSPEALPALTSETKGQNSWVNSGPQLRDANGQIIKPGQPGYVPPNARPFAEQKAGLLPDRFHYRLDTPVSFVSPNTFDLNMDRAGIRLGSVSHRMFANLSNSLAAELNLKPVTNSAIGSWEGGAENSVIQHFPIRADPQAVEYHAAMMAKLGNQNSWAAFFPDEKGSDSLYGFHVDENTANPKKIASILQKNGIDNSTIEPNSEGGHTVWISSSGDTLEPNVDAVAKELGDVNVGRFKGSAKTGGSGESRDAAAAEHTRNIEELEKGHPEWEQVRNSFESRPDYGTLHRLIRGTDNPFLEVKHGSTRPELKEISPGNYGTGPQKGAEAARKNAYPEYWEDRSYFQIKGTKGERLYERLPHQYQALLNSENIYDIVRDPENLKGGLPANLTDPAGRFTALEKMVKDNGYDGLYTPDGVVEVFTKTPTMPEEKPAEDKKEEPAAEEEVPTSLVDVNSDTQEVAENPPEPVGVGSTGTAPPTVIPLHGGTTLGAAPVQEPAVAMSTKQVLPLNKVKEMAAALNLNHTVQPQVSSVRELMKQARARMIP